VNGIGERAGNASLEEVVMAIRTRKDYMKVGTQINTKEIYKTSQLLISITGVPVQPNKAIVGENAFAHESGIHQDGVLKKRTTFEIMTPASIGAKKSRLVLGKHSGRHAFSKRLEELGYKLKQEALDKAFGQFKILADKKKEIFDEDLQSIVGEEISSSSVNKVFELVHLQTSSGTNTVPTATVSLKKGDKVTTDSSIGDGPVDATYKAIERITGIKGKLMSYNIRSVTLGKDAVGEVTLRARIGNEMYAGKGSSTDVIEASAKAWLTAINRKAGGQ
ncbi:2-isopropylmalate synthase, partial [hydrothermal vent metagenome]